MHRIKLVSVGGCTGYDILTTNVQWRSKFQILQKYEGSVSRSFFKPGKVAARLYDDMIPHMKKYPPALMFKIQRQLDVILKTNPITNIIKKQTPNTVVIIDPSYELADFYEKGDEAFDILGHWADIEEYFPSWFKKEIAENLCKFDMKGTVTAFQRLSHYREFFRLMEEHKCFPFFIDNPATERVYVKELNSVAVNISLFCSKIPFLTANEKGEYTTLNFEYAIKSIDNLYKRLKDSTAQYYADDPERHSWFPVKKDLCFADPEHRWGYHPAHLHHLSRSTMSQDMHDAILDLYTRNLVVESNINFKESPNGQ